MPNIYLVCYKQFNLCHAEFMSGNIHLYLYFTYFNTELTRVTGMIQHPCVLHSTYHDCSWWRHHMETFSALVALSAGNSPVTGGFPSQRPVARRFDVFFDLCLNKQLSKHSWGWWFETPSRSLWRHCIWWFAWRRKVTIHVYDILINYDFAPALNNWCLIQWCIKHFFHEGFVSNEIDIHTFWLYISKLWIFTCTIERNVCALTRTWALSNIILTISSQHHAT